MELFECEINKPRKLDTCSRSQNSPNQVLAPHRPTALILDWAGNVRGVRSEVKYQSPIEGRLTG